MHPLRWLEAAFGTPTRIKILRLLCRNASRTWTERAIARELGLSPNGTNKAVGDLEAAGVLDVRPAGRAHVVRIRPNVSRWLERVFAVETEAWQDVLAGIRETVPSGASCYVFGSTVRGEARPDSDIDLLIIAADRERATEVAHAVDVEVRERFAAEPAFLMLSSTEARARKRGGVVRKVLAHGLPASDPALEALT